MYIAEHPQAIRLYKKHDNGHGQLSDIPSSFLKKITDQLDEGEDLTLGTMEDDFCDEPEFAREVNKDPRMAAKVFGDPEIAQREIDRFHKKRASASNKSSGKKNLGRDDDENEEGISSTAKAGGKGGKAGKETKSGKSKTGSNVKCFFNIHKWPFCFMSFEFKYLLNFFTHI